MSPSLSHALDARAMILAPAQLTSRQLVRALAVAPLAAPATYTVYMIVKAVFDAAFGSGTLPSIGPLLDIVGGVATIGIPIAYLAMLVAGAPVAFLLRRTGLLNLPALVLSGTLVGILTAFALRPVFYGQLFSIPFALWEGAMLGLATGVTVWRLLRNATTR